MSSSLFVRLLPLSLALFAVGTDGFVIAGLLPAIAHDLAVDIPAAGQLVTAFALAFAVSAPVLGAATSAVDAGVAAGGALGGILQQAVMPAVPRRGSAQRCWCGAHPGDRGERHLRTHQACECAIHSLERSAVATAGAW